MKPKTLLIIVPMLASLLGCSDTRKEEQAKADGAAKARAEAARKEMKTLPKVFRSRDIFQKAEPVKTDSKAQDPATAQKR